MTVFKEYQFRPAAPSWKIPFNIAVISHVLIFATAIVLPEYIQKKPIIPDFLTVDLVNIAAPLSPSVQQSTQASPKQKVTIQKLQPVASRKTAPIAPIAPAIVPETPTEPIKAISIKPLRRKVKKKIVVDTRASDRERQRAKERKRQQQILANQRQQLQQDAKRQQALADAEEAAANDAVKALRKMLQADSAVAAAKKNSQATAGRPGGGSSSVIESQYQASIENRLSQHWALPEIKPWNPSLSARVVIHIGKNGSISSHNFEKRSGDRVFDQFVSRTIQESNPLPPIPGAMKVSKYSIGLHFTPGQIQ